MNPKNAKAITFCAIAIFGGIILALFSVALVLGLGKNPYQLQEFSTAHLIAIEIFVLIGIIIFVKDNDEIRVIDYPGDMTADFGKGGS